MIFAIRRIVNSEKCIVAALYAFITALALLLFASCGDRPAGSGYDSSYDVTGETEVDLSNNASFLLASAKIEDIAYGRIELWAYNLASNADSGTVSFDAALVNGSDALVGPPVRFVITGIMPDGVNVLNPDGYDREGHPYFDFSRAFGNDGVLTPGEKSEIKRFVFHTGVPKTFAIAYRFDFSWDLPGKSVSGVVFYDFNRNGERDSCEAGIQNVWVHLYSNNPDGSGIHRSVHSGESGLYAFFGLDDGVYTVQTTPPFHFVHTTPNPVIVTLIGDQENLLSINFGLVDINTPPNYNLFGPVPVGPGSPMGAVVDSTFYLPCDTTGFDFTTPFALEIAPPPIMSPLPMIIDTIRVSINDTLVHEFFRDEYPDSTIDAYITVPVPAEVMHPGINRVYMEARGENHSFLMMRIYSFFRIKPGC